MYLLEQSKRRPYIICYHIQADLLQHMPVMQYYLFSGERYSTGIETIEDEHNFFRIYDPEKTVCDILFYRNKLGFETAMEVLKTYLQREDRDLNRLMKYAEKLRCGKLLREYLEVIV